MEGIVRDWVLRVEVLPDCLVKQQSIAPAAPITAQADTGRILIISHKKKSQAIKYMSRFHVAQLNERTLNTKFNIHLSFHLKFIFKILMEINTHSHHQQTIMYFNDTTSNQNKINKRTSK